MIRLTVAPSESEVTRPPLFSYCLPPVGVERVEAFFILRKTMTRDSAGILESDGHFLSVLGQRIAINGPKKLASLTENSHGVVRLRPKCGDENGRKQPNHTACDSRVAHGQNR